MSIGRNTVANLAGNIVPMLVSLATIPLYLNYIGVERYGILAVIWILFGYFGIIDFGFGRAVAQRMARLSTASDCERSNLLWTAINSIFLFGVMSGVILWAFSDLILTHAIDMSAPNRAEAKKSVTWLVLALPIVFVIAVLRGALQARLRFVAMNTIEIISASLSHLLPLSMAASGHIEVEILVLAALAPKLLTVTLLLKQCRKHVPLSGRPVIKISHLKSVTQYGGWVWLATLLISMVENSDRLAIGLISGAKELAFYAIPFGLVSRVAVVSTSATGALFPRLVMADDTSAHELALRTATMLVAIMTPISILGIFIVQPFLNLWVGEDIAQSCAGVAEIIFFGVWIYALLAPYRSLLLSTDRPIILVIIYLVEIPVYFFMLWYGIHYWGIVGAAIAWSLRFLMDTIIQTAVCGSLTDIFFVARFPSILVTIAILTALSTQPESYIRWYIALTLLGSTLFKDHKHLIQMASSLLQRSKFET